MRKGIMRICALALILTMAACAALAEPQTVTGTATGMGAVSVELTVEDGKITGATVDTSNETAGFGLDIADELAAQLTQAGSAEIDGVSGCTITSNAVKAAAAAALEQAGVAGEKAAMVPGVYAGTAQGAKNPITMLVEVSEDEILNVWVGESNDTAVFSANAVKTVAKEIVDQQSLAVDVYTGATLSSNGAINAVAAAMTAAGANVTDWMKSEPVSKTVAATEEYDIVIVGGGTSGLSAAISAKTDDQYAKQNDLRVLVVERNSFGGGDMGISGGYVAVPSGNPIAEANGVEMLPEDVTRNMLALNPNAADFANEELSLAVWSKGPAAITGLMNRGFYLNIEDAHTAPLGDGSITAAFTSDPVTGYRCGDDWYDAMTGAPYEGWTLTRAAEDAGVEIRFNTEATGLVIENGACVGVTVEDKTSTYQINAKRIILATGWGGFDADSRERFYPDVANVVGAQNEGNTSDAQKWIADMGGEIIYYPDANYIVPAYNAVLRDNGEYGYLFQKGQTMWVNSKAERFFDESTILGNGLTDTGALLRTLDDGYAYMIFGSDNETCAKYGEELIGYGAAWSAATVQELAEKAGLPGDALASAVAAYNAACETGEDTAFGTPADFLTPITGEKLYAARIAPTSTASMPISVYTDADMIVTLSKGGERIENLMACGGAAGNMVPVAGFGAHVYEALCSGALAGEYAREAVLGE